MFKYSASSRQGSPSIDRTADFHLAAGATVIYTPSKLPVVAPGVKGGNDTEMY